MSKSERVAADLPEGRPARSERASLVTVSAHADKNGWCQIRMLRDIPERGKSPLGVDDVLFHRVQTKPRISGKSHVTYHEAEHTDESQGIL